MGVLTCYDNNIGENVQVTPLQIVVGDSSARKVAAYQPAKAAAMEAHWLTNPPGTGAPFAVLALPDKEREENRWSLEAPNLLSFLSFHTMKGRVPGLREFPPQDRPPVGLPFYAFRIMVLIGFVRLFGVDLLVPVILIYNMYMHGVYRGKVHE